MIARRHTYARGVKTGLESQIGAGARRPGAANASSVWERAREELRDSIPPSTFRLWVEPLRAVSMRGSTLYLTGPDHVRRWVERRYGRRLGELLRGQDEAVAEVGFLAEASEPRHAEAVEPRRPDTYTFDRFVIGPGNRFAHAAALAVAELPGEAYNPLFLHGAPGLGKSHLLIAIANYIAANHPGMAVRYTTAERFTADFVASLRNEGVARFKRRHREVGALLVDDVQFLEAKPHTEEEFFHTFNELHDCGAQIVLSSDRPPADLARIAERLRNRFEWGLCVELRPPDLATRLVVLRRLVVEGGYALEDPAALEAIARHAPADVRKLEGALTRVLAFASVGRTEVTPTLVEELLGARPLGELDSSEPPSAAVGVEQIKEAVARTLHVPVAELSSRKRTPPLTRARHLAIYLSRQLTDLPLVEIGRAFDRDHSTVLHAIRTISRKLEPGSELDRALGRIHSELRLAHRGS